MSNRSPYVYNQQLQQENRLNANALRCARCGSNNIQVSMVQTGAKTNTRNASLSSRIGRMLLIYLTAGIWLLVTKRKTQSKTKFINQKMAVCQNCGYSWTVK